MFGSSPLDPIDVLQSRFEYLGLPFDTSVLALIFNGLRDAPGAPGWDAASAPGPLLMNITDYVSSVIVLGLLPKA